MEGYAVIPVGLRPVLSGARRTEQKIVYKRYASLFFIACIGNEENELYTLEAIHQYVEVLDRYFGNVRTLFWGRFPSLFALICFACRTDPVVLLSGLRA